MGRSVKKGPFTDTHLEIKLTALTAANEKKVVRTWSRRSTILPEFVGHTVAVHDRIDAMSDDSTDLVIVDIVRPRQGGCAKLRDLQKARPRTPVIAISGQFTAASTGAPTASSLGVRRVIGKPFTREHLLRVVGDVLGASIRTVDA